MTDATASAPPSAEETKRAITPGGIAAFYRWRPPDQLYGWDVLGGGPGGVTDDLAIAAGYVQAELERAPEGSVGTVHRVTLAGAQVGYTDLGEVARARRTADGVVWVEPGAER